MKISVDKQGMTEPLTQEQVEYLRKVTTLSPVKTIPSPPTKTAP